MTPEELLTKGIDLMKRKAADYTAGDDRYENFKRSAEISSWFVRDIDKVFAVLIATKLVRLASLLGRDKTPNNEAIEDTFQDFVNYGALWGGCHSQEIETLKKYPDIADNPNWIPTASCACPLCIAARARLSQRNIANAKSPHDV